jgi:hypothetical protein
MITILSKKELVEDKYLRICDTDEVRAVIADCAIQRLTNGKAMSKNKNIGAAGDIPSEVYWNPHLRYIFHNPDPKERERLTRRFLEERSAFKTTTRRLI